MSDVYLPPEKETVVNADQFSLKRLDSYHLNQLTAKAFESPVKSAKLKRSGADGLNFSIKNVSPSPFKFSESQSPSKYDSPIKKFGLNKLEKISEKDSFCTDASMVSFCSDELHSSKKKGRKTENLTLAKYKLTEDQEEISEEDGDDESLAEHLRVVAGTEEDGEQMQLDGSPIKLNLKNPGLAINKIITKAKRDAKEVIMVTRNCKTTQPISPVGNTSKCMFTMHKVELMTDEKPKE